MNLFPSQQKLVSFFASDHIHSSLLEKLVRQQTVVLFCPFWGFPSTKTRHESGLHHRQPAGCWGNW